MASIDVDVLLREVSPEAPCGEDLSYDPAYTEMDTILAQGQSTGMVADEAADEVEGPDWRALHARCLELLASTKDLRVAVNLSLAALMEGGFEGLRDGLAVLRGLLDGFWDTVWPQLDPDDNNDPLERLNIISSLSPAPGAYMDPMMFCQRTRQAPLVQSARVGRFSLADIESAGGGGGEEGESNSAALINAAFEDSSSEALQSTARAIDEAIECIQAIEDTLTERVGVGQALDLSALRDGVLRKARGAMEDYLVRRGLSSGSTVEASDEPVAGGAAAPVAALSGEIRSPQDVLKAFEKICQYYEQSEPSSPVPLLVRRAMRLVSRSYLEIVRDLTPESIEQVERIGGIDNPAGGE